MEERNSLHHSGQPTENKQQIVKLPQKCVGTTHTVTNTSLLKLTIVQQDYKDLQKNTC